MVSKNIYPIKRISIIVMIATMFVMAKVSKAQERPLKDFPKKGSYLYYGQPAFEDNSFLLEEAFNQPMGVIQHISSLTTDKFHGGNWVYSFTQEIPLTDLTHQISYSLYYNVLNSADVNRKSGFGDLYVSYRPYVLGEKDWAMVIPRFTLIVPTGKAIDGQGCGGWGGQFNLAVTKRLSRKLVSHYNAGVTLISKADKYLSTTIGDSQLIYEKNLSYKNIGASIVWYPMRKLNLLLEYVSNFGSDIEASGNISHNHQLTLNPGMRFCIDNGRMQIVPGVSMPLNIEKGQPMQSGLFFYLSFEPDYLNFYRPKEQ